MGRAIELSRYYVEHAMAALADALAGRSSTYSHTQTPNRKSCYYTGIGQDWSAAVNALTASSRHPGGVNVLWGDGHASFFSEDTPRERLRALLTSNGGEHCREMYTDDCDLLGYVCAVLSGLLVLL